MRRMEEGRISGGESPSLLRLSVAEAAAALGITEAAVRSRIQRGTIRSYREDGGVIVVLTAHETRDEASDETSANRDETSDESAAQHVGGRDDPRGELIEELRDRVRSLEEANRENRRIIAALTQRVPEIEPPPERPPAGRESSETSLEELGKERARREQAERERDEALEALRGAQVNPETVSQRFHSDAESEDLPEPPESRSWWQRWFGGG
jgi:hypothetical protein